MQGNIIEYRDELQSGLIRGADGNRYQFGINDCKSVIKPRTGAEVDFETQDNKAIEIYVLTKDIASDVKDAASTAAIATSSTVRAIIRKIKIILPRLIAIVVLGGIGVYVFGVVVPEARKEALRKEQLETAQRENERINSLLIDANAKCKAKDYDNAILKYEEVVNSSSSSCELTYPYFCLPRGTYPMSECFIEMKKPLKALSLIGSPTDHLDNGQQTYGPPIAKVHRYIIAARAYSLLKENDIANFYAKAACNNGDCSLVEK
ncbi:hypothetical protein ACO0LB_06185 [Undibacterium sp. SXout7W]|uniref:hypothetical protein n=1 Tax=Undibacterium sp. SXout7W TaxID=3413049 RepID=UPI003BF09002